MDAPKQDLVRLLDQIAANAWPASVQQALEGWRLRANEGVTRRANSVLTAAPVPTYAAWLEQIEDFYRRRQLPPRFQISDGSPEGLDALLDARGYRSEAHSIVQIARAREVNEAARTARAAPAPHVIESDHLEEEWLEAYVAIEGAPQTRKAAYRTIYSAIGPRSRFLRAIAEDGSVSAVGLAVTERGWTGFFSMATRPEYRGHGLATCLISLIAEWSLSCGAHSLYLQVVQDNDGAVRLYEKLGFARLYGYHYRTL
jgi:GNAT superfamily N-acetyltransferase